MLDLELRHLGSEGGMERLGLGPFHPLTVFAFIGGMLAVSTGLHLLV